MQREANIKRKTGETDITVSLNIDGEGKASIDTGIGFFDHMLTALTKHSGMDIAISCKGDLYVDGHHSVEDVGIALGKAFAEALGDKVGIVRFGFASCPLDEALASAVVDISGRAYLVYDCSFAQDKIGELDSQLVEEFFRAFASNAGITLHVKCEYGVNDHHKAEAMFKSCARALRQATSIDPRFSDQVASTKGVL
ncbi:MAG: imidazoleglycerol-phosphate dehydratase HisB [Clostridiales bacterium]|nr:imidazoleglycerol-phosphate dehydratase HisB [Clostridiales bacterium]